MRPKPFRRPRIEILPPEEKREWDLVPASSVRPGDVTSEVGLVRHARREGDAVALEGPEKTARLDANDQVMAYVRTDT